MATDVGQTAEHSANPKPRRRWLQFRLRTLLVFILVFGVGFGWLGVKVRQAREQREAVRQLRGLVGYQPASDGTVRATITWLGKLFGEDLSGDVTSLRLWTPPVTDADLRYVGEFTQLQTLRLDHSQVTNTGLEHLERLTQLRILEVQDTQVTDAGLEHLKGLAQLQRLNLSFTQVTDAGLEHLTGLTQLQELDLNFTQITNAGLEHLKGLNQLRGIGLGGTHVTVAGVRQLKGLAQLQTLRLTGTEEVMDAGAGWLLAPVGISRRQELWLLDDKVADSGLGDLRGLARLHNLTSLRELYINSTWGTDAGLEHLKARNQLRTLSGLGVTISTDVVYQLGKALPNVKITR